ncbi:MAG: cytochrome C oxidase subunit IV family protein [Bacillota bacterium]
MQSERSQDQATHGTAYGLYVRTWVWLLLITLLELGVVSVSLPRVLVVTLLVVLAMMKGALIMAYFMHLRFERLSFVYVVLSPLIFTVILFGAIAPDALNRIVG